MSDDQTRDRDASAQSNEAGAHYGDARRSNPDAPATDDNPTDPGAEVPPPLDIEAVEKHRAAKQARQRKRREEMLRRQGLEPDDQLPERPNRGGGGGAARGRGGGGGGQGGGKRGRGALPAMRPELKADTPALRAERVEAIRRDLVRRRRRKGGGLLLKLFFCVMLPTTLVGYFLWFVASDMYQSESKFMVQSADGAGGAQGSSLLASFVGGGGGINDPVAVQSYVSSRDVLRLLDGEQAWIAHFQAPTLDILNRLEPDASFEEAFRHYEEMVNISFDPTEGIIEMDVVAADPDTARRFNQAIIRYAEGMVDDLASRIRTDAISDAERNLREAERDLKAAQLAEAEMRKKLEVFSVDGEVTATMGLIAGMESELEGLIARLTNLRRVTSDQDPRVQRIQNQVDTLRGRIVERRSSITGGTSRDQGSLADIKVEMMRAQIDVQSALAIFTAALDARELARANATRQHRYLSVVAAPSLPDEPNYPRKPQMLALAFIGFLGFYIVASLTVSLIREQASI